MQLPTFVYQRLLASRGAARKFWAALRSLLIRLGGDPACVLPVHGQPLRLPLSHALPVSLQCHPFYDRLPGRLAHYLRGKYGPLTCIDVGANVGDSVAAFGGAGASADRFLAVEPSPHFRSYLQANWGGCANVCILDCLCTAETGAGKYRVYENGGSARILPGAGGVMASLTLDEIVRRHADFAGFNVLKTDTDGYDFEVIAGGRESISQNRPAVLFECDVFSNEDYVEDCLGTMLFFRGAGYQSFLVYDNFGYLLGRHSLSDLRGFRNLLFYQSTGGAHYYDVLVLREEDAGPFFAAELEHFVAATRDGHRRRTAATAASVCLAA